MVRAEEDPDFSPGGPDGWFWSGYDADGRVIAYAARGDIEPPEYIVYTCADDQ